MVATPWLNYVFWWLCLCGTPCIHTAEKDRGKVNCQLKQVLCQQKGILSRSHEYIRSTSPHLTSHRILHTRFFFFFALCSVLWYIVREISRLAIILFFISRNHPGNPAGKPLEDQDIIFIAASLQLSDYKCGGGGRGKGEGDPLKDRCWKVYHICLVVLKFPQLSELSI